SCVWTKHQRNSPATDLLKLTQQACRRSINKKYFGVKPIGTGPSGYAAYGSGGNPRKTRGFPPLPQARGKRSPRAELSAPGPNASWPSLTPLHFWERRHFF